MKKIFWSLILLCISSWAIGQNVIGSPRYYSDSSQYKPWHGYGYEKTHRSFENSLFIESQVLCGSYDVACGANIAWVPENVGFYGSFMTGINADWWSFGPVVRLSDKDSYTDVQLYGGITLADFYSGLYPGGEIGIRVSKTEDSGILSLCGASIGMRYVGGSSFLTLGISLPLIIFFIPTTIFF